MNTLEDRLRAALTAKSDGVALSMLTRSLPPLDADPESDGVEPDAAPVITLPASRPHHPRRILAAALAVAAVLLVAFGAVALHRATSDKTLGPAHVRPRSAIPWDKVGPDWTLVQETRTLQDGRPDATGVQQLQLVGPDGDRYQITSLPAPVYLIAWDGRNRHALLHGGYMGIDETQRIEEDKLIVVDLADGAQHAFAAPAYALPPRFDGSEGQYVTYVNGVHRVERYGLTGQPQQPSRPIPSSELVADSPDGRQAIVDSRSGLDVYDYASGQRVRNLLPPTGYAGCYNPQWGNDGKLTAICLQAADRTKKATFVFSVNGVPAAGRADPQYPTVDTRLISFRRGVMTVFYAYDDLHPAVDGYALNRATITRFDAGGQAISVPVPTQFQDGSWMIANSSPDAFTVVNTGSPAFDATTAVSWNPFTGQITELVRAARGEALVSVLPWGAQQPF